MSESELQNEEREVLLSIYDGDTSFKEITSNTFQYKYGENDSLKSFLLEIKWSEKYPNEMPEINMDTFYNKHVVNSLKTKIIGLIKEEAKQYLGMSMTYSLFEYVKEKFDELIEEQPENSISDSFLDSEKLPIDLNEEDLCKKAPKKEQLTKAQKRRQWNRTDNKGEKPRGWNWVDIVKHLSQTGANNNNKQETVPAT